MNLSEAIDRSKQLAEIVTVQYDGTLQEALASLAEIWPDKIDHCEFAPHTLDVWGFTDETPENQQDWRLTVECKDEN